MVPYSYQVIAEGKKISTVHAAQAEAEHIRLVGDAEATSIAAKGKAEAERMALKAESYKVLFHFSVFCPMLDFDEK